MVCEIQIDARWMLNLYLTENLISLVFDVEMAVVGNVDFKFVNVLGFHEISRLRLIKLISELKMHEFYQKNCGNWC